MSKNGEIPKIKVKNLYKIFGASPRQSLKKLQAGISKEELFKKTGHVELVALMSRVED